MNRKDEPSEAAKALVASITLLLELSPTTAVEDITVLIYMVGSLCKKFERQEGAGAAWIKERIKKMTLSAYLAFGDEQGETRQ